MPDDPGPSKNERGGSLSRRQFALRAALASAATTLTPGALLSAAPSPVLQQPAGSSALPAESEAEIEARIQSILGRYGSRFSDAQKSEIRRLAAALQAPLESVRAHSLTNDVPPALYLKPLVEREKPSMPATKPKT